MINSIKSAELNEKNVLIRVDLNVPLKNGFVSDATRIKATIPTINLVLKKGGRPILLSHFGRPQKLMDESFSLRKILPKIREVIKQKVLFCGSINPSDIRSFIKQAPKNRIILLENTRFFDGEERNCLDLKKTFSSFGDVFCNDAFSVSHREHASTVGVAQELPSYSGLLLEKELAALEKSFLKPKKPLVAIVGGSKVSSKITLLKSLIKKIDNLIIGGGMANTFLYAQGKEIGRSICEKHLFNLAIEILGNAKKFNCNIHLPIDVACAQEFKEYQERNIYDVNSCPADKIILDAGPKTILKITTILQDSKTLIWNGPLGAFETEPFNIGTIEVAKIAGSLAENNKLFAVVGGGDTVAALQDARVLRKISYVSNAGGAFLQWLEGKNLPSIKALEAKQN